MHIRNIRNIDSIFHKDNEPASGFFSGLALIDKSLVFFSADIRRDFVHAVLGVYANPWDICIIAPGEFAPHQIYVQRGEALMFYVMFVGLLSAVLYDPHGQLNGVSSGVPSGTFTKSLSVFGALLESSSLMVLSFGTF